MTSKPDTRPTPTVATDEVERAEAANGLDHVASALREVHALSGLGDPAFDASMFGQIAAVERGASLLRRAAISSTRMENGEWRERCAYLLACIDQSNEAEAPVDESDPEDIAEIDTIRALLGEQGK